MSRRVNCSTSTPATRSSSPATFVMRRGPPIGAAAAVRAIPPHPARPPLQEGAARCVARRPQSRDAVSPHRGGERVHDSERHGRDGEDPSSDQRPALCVLTDFALGPGGVRTVFPLRRRDEPDIDSADGNGSGLQPARRQSPLDELRSPSGAVGHLAFGRFSARNYLVQSGAFIPSSRARALAGRRSSGRFL